MAQNRSGKLGEKALDEVEPGAMLGSEGEREAAVRLSGEPSVRLLGDVGGMIVEDQPDRGVGRISGIEKFEELDELAAAMTILGQSMNLAAEEIDPSQQAD